MSDWHTLATVATATCWGLVGLAWLVAAVYNEQQPPSLRKRAERVFPWAFVFVLILFLLRGIPRVDWRSLTVRSGWSYAPGLAILLASTAFTLWARAALEAIWTFSPVPNENQALRSDGPYAITRHPIYTGTLGMLVGTTLLAGLGRWLVVLVLAAAFIERQIRAEERALVEAFPGRYEQYRRRVPRLVPGALRLRGALSRRLD